MTIVPLSLQEARRFVAEHHRHNAPPVGHKFSIGLRAGDELVGVVIAGRPSGRGSDDGLTLELTRLTTLGDRNACSRLYGAACRAAAAMGYRRVITYTGEDEAGTSLLASGFRVAGTTSGRPWLDQARPGLLLAAQRLTLFEEAKMPAGPKTRWERLL